jgi:hypothetical protein
MLVFKNGENITTYVIVDRDKLDFYGLDKANFSISEAKFKISINNKGRRSAKLINDIN